MPFDTAQNVLANDLVAWIIPKNILSLVFFNAGGSLNAT